MTPDELSPLPADSRVWLYGTHRPPEDGEAARLVDATRAFLEDWTAHGSPLRAALDWRHGRFLVLAVDESRAAASGCSIDAVTGRLADLESELDLPLLDTSPVWYRDPGRDGRIRTVSRSTFRRLGREGEVDGGTVVFDLTVDRLGDVRQGLWERPAADTWHASLLPDVDSSDASEA